MDLSGTIKPELVVLVPILDMVGVWLKRVHVKTRNIGITIFTISLLLVTIYELTKAEFTGFHDYFVFAFAIITQSAIIAGTSVSVSELIARNAIRNVSYEGDEPAEEGAQNGEHASNASASDEAAEASVG